MKLRLTSANGRSLMRYIKDLKEHFNIEQTEIKGYTCYLIELNTIQDLAKVIEITGYSAVIDEGYITELDLVIYDDYME